MPLPSAVLQRHYPWRDQDAHTGPLSDWNQTDSKCDRFPSREPDLARTPIARTVEPVRSGTTAASLHRPRQA